MKIYWKKSDIPQLKGLDYQQQSALLQPIIKDVWRHWQVWLPFVLQVMFTVWLVRYCPVFPYKLWVSLVLIYVTIKFALVPYNHFLAWHLDNIKQSVE